MAAVWHVHRVAGRIVSAHAEPQPGYAEEALDESNNELAVFLDAARNPVPQIVEAGDFVHALYDLEWLADVKTAVGAADGLAQELWDRASLFERKHPLVSQIAKAIGKTEADLDLLFRKTLEYK